MQYDFLAIGDITSDTFIKLKEGMHIDEAHGKYGKAVCLNFGDKVEYEDATIIHGVGNAGNAAVSAQRLGLATALLTDIGTDQAGDDCLHAWEQEGLSTEFVRRHAEYATHHHYVLRYGAERTILIKHQPWPYALPEFTEAPKWLYFTSTGEHGESFHHEIAAFLKDHPTTKLAFQPGTFQIQLSADGKIPDVYEVTEVFFCNKEEAQRILASKEDDILMLLVGIRALGPKVAVITDGPRGAHVQNNEGTWMMPMYPDPAPPVDRTGAGDSFASTFTAMLAQGMSMPDAIARAPINSMSVVQKIGAQAGLLKRSDLEELLRNAPSDYVARKIA